jgi:hypothetical protein
MCWELRYVSTLIAIHKGRALPPQAAEDAFITGVAWQQPRDASHFGTQLLKCLHFIGMVVRHPAAVTGKGKNLQSDVCQSATSSEATHYLSIASQQKDIPRHEQKHAKVQQ